MRFDDSLRTVLASDTASDFGAQATWRQLVDLAGRGRIAADDATIARLRALRRSVASPVRAASARALAFAHPPAPLVALFAEDEPAIAAPVLRTAALTGDEWVAVLPRMNQIGRSVLRHRRDLPPAAVRGLESFGSVDFVLEQEPRPAAPDPAIDPAETPAGPRPAAHDEGFDRAPPPDLGAIARLVDVTGDGDRDERAGRDGFGIADLKARIDAFRRERPPPPPEPPAIDTFRFETDAAGVVRWVDGGPRGALIGLSLARSGGWGLARIDAAPVAAFQERRRISGVALTIGGRAAAAGTWRLAAAPLFDEASARFAGYRGVGRRLSGPAAAGAPPGGDDLDTLRQLVHELRTPANAIAGFAELIETQLLGPVADPYRGRAGAIRRETDALLAAIDDLDLAARLQGGALALRPATILLEPLVARALGDLAMLGRHRGAAIVFEPDGTAAVHADEGLADRLAARLLAALLTIAAPGERLRARVRAESDGRVALQVDRPATLTALTDEALLALPDDTTVEADAGAGTLLLGAGFALRLVRDLASAAGGGLTISPARVSLRLPAASFEGDQPPG